MIESTKAGSSSNQNFWNEIKWSTPELMLSSMLTKYSRKFWACFTFLAFFIMKVITEPMNSYQMSDWTHEYRHPQHRKWKCCAWSLKEKSSESRLDTSALTCQRREPTLLKHPSDNEKRLPRRKSFQFSLSVGWWS